MRDRALPALEGSATRSTCRSADARGAQQPHESVDVRGEVQLLHVHVAPLLNRLEPRDLRGGALGPSWGTSRLTQHASGTAAILPLLRIPIMDMFQVRLRGSPSSPRKIMNCFAKPFAPRLTPDRVTMHPRSCTSAVRLA